MTTADTLEVAGLGLQAVRRVIEVTVNALREQAELFAQRILAEAPDDTAKQIDLGYEYALGRPATDLERSLALETAKKSLVDFTHVLMNLSEFLYMR